jgi:hypothetical protein
MGLSNLAIEEFQNAVALSHHSENLAALGYAYNTPGGRAEAFKIVTQLQRQPARNFVFPFDMASVLAGLGQKDKAFSYLDQAYRGRDSRLPSLAVDHWFDSLHADPRFAELCLRTGLPAVSVRQ